MMELMEPSLHMWLTFGFIAVAIVFYAIDRIPLELTSLGVVACLLLMYHLYPLTGADGANLLETRRLLAGFADPALISILALLVIGQGMVQTGALEAPAQTLVRWGINYPRLIILACLISVMVISAFLNNTPVVVIFIPIIIVLMDKLEKPASQVLMPLSFVAILGGMTTLIGSSTNLLVAGAYKGQTGIELTFFEFTVPGLFMLAVGLLYVLLIAPRLLPKKSAESDAAVTLSGKQFIIQIDLQPGNSLIGKQSIAGMFPDLSGVTVRLVRSGRKNHLPPFDDITLHEGDQIILAATRRVLTDKISKNPTLLQGALSILPEQADAESEANNRKRQQLGEVLVAPASRLDGRTLEQVGYHLQGGCKVLGVQRRSRMVRTSMDEIRLEAGDILLVVGTPSQVKALRSNKDVLLMEWSTSEVPVKTDSWKAISIFFGVVALAATGLVPIPVTATLGAFMMIVLGCLNVRQASRAIDRRIFLLVGAALAMGAALQASGGAMWLARSMIELLHGASIPVVLSAFFLLIAFLTNILSNNATAVLFTPIAVNIAQQLDADPLMFVTAVIFAANCSFATPMGYQTNLLVMGPGNYKFNDFMKVGIPLIIILWIGYSLFAPWYYGLL